MTYRTLVTDPIVKASRQTLADTALGLSDDNVISVASGMGLSGDKQRVPIDKRFGQKDAVFTMGSAPSTGG